jgi:hypothetical protein
MQGANFHGGAAFLPGSRSGRPRPILARHSGSRAGFELTRAAQALQGRARKTGPAAEALAIEAFDAHHGRRPDEEPENKGRLHE